MTPQDMRHGFDALRAASLRAQTPPWRERADRLKRLRALVVAHRADIAAAISADFHHRAAQETELAEVFPSVEGIDHALRHGKRWMRVKRRATGLWFKPASSRVMPQPLGVVGIVVPWNYPLYLAVGPMTAALAAGNRVMVKQSEFTPRFAELFAALVRKAFAPDEIAIVNGDAEAARAFCALPFDHLLFTGSTAVGHQVMRAASENLTPVTLELGGKSPAIVGPGAELRQGRGAHPRGQDAERGPDLHRARLRAAARRPAAALRRGGAARVRGHVPAPRKQHRLHQHREPAPLRAAAGARAPRRSSKAPPPLRCATWRPTPPRAAFRPCCSPA
jgi:acyl-CoA reductase-like NAD-dependent aldehyde dehydrogenase